MWKKHWDKDNEGQIESTVPIFTWILLVGSDKAIKSNDNWLRGRMKLNNYTLFNGDGHTAEPRRTRVTCQWVEPTFFSPSPPPPRLLDPFLTPTIIAALEIAQKIRYGIQWWRFKSLLCNFRKITTWLFARHTIQLLPGNSTSYQHSLQVIADSPVLVSRRLVT